jgi:plastocyanin
VGAGLALFLLTFLGGFWGCQVAESDRSRLTSAEARSLGLDPGARLHRVSLGGRGAEEHAVPTVIHASPGDAVEFVTVDHRVHTVIFMLDSVAPVVRMFLEDSGQESSPLLVDRGNRFLLNLRDAPSGVYPFVSEGHGGSAHGRVEVGPPSQPERTQGS